MKLQRARNMNAFNQQPTQITQNVLLTQIPPTSCSSGEHAGPNTNIEIDTKHRFVYLDMSGHYVEGNAT